MRVSKVVILALIGVVVGLCWRGLAATDIPPKPSELVLSTFGFGVEHVEKHVVRPFEEQYGIRIVLDLGTNAARLTRLMAHRDRPIVDVAVFAANFAVLAMNDGLLQPINPENVRNLAEIAEWARDPLGGYFGIAYTMSVMKIAYNTEQVYPPVTSWRDFWRPDVAGRITLPHINTTFGPLVLIAIAEAWGGSVDDLEIGWQKLGELVRTGALLAPYTRSAEVISWFERDEIVMAPIPSFAWPMLEGLRLPLRWVPPKEGVLTAFNTLSVVRGTKHAYWAEKFINFWLSRSAQEGMALAVVDAPVNKFVGLPPDIRARLGLDVDPATLVFYDQIFITERLEDWVARWDEVVAR